MTLGLRPPERKVRRRFDDQEREYIKNNPTMPIAVLANHLGRCDISISAMRRKLGMPSLTKLGQHPRIVNRALREKGEIPQTAKSKGTELLKVHESLQASIWTEPEEGLTYQLSTWLAPYKLAAMEQGCITAGRRYCIVCKNDLYAIFREPL